MPVNINRDCSSRISLPAGWSAVLLSLVDRKAENLLGALGEQIVLARLEHVCCFNPEQAILQTSHGEPQVWLVLTGPLLGILRLTVAILHDEAMERERLCVDGFSGEQKHRFRQRGPVLGLWARCRNLSFRARRSRTTLSLHQPVCL